MVIKEREAITIIKKNIYMTISTCDKSNPWISPVSFAYDSDYNLYWASEKSAKHSKLIKKNSNVAIVIFDSSTPEGVGNGVYIVGKAAEIRGKELPDAVKILCSRKKKDSEYSKFQSTEDFTGNSPWRMYKIIPKKFWTLKDGTNIRGYPVDRE